MRQATMILVALSLLAAQLMCCQITLPDIEVNVPVSTVQVGEMRDQQETIPVGEAESTAVKIVFGAGELDIEAGASEELLSGRFRYNVDIWEPEVAYEDGVLTVEQGGSEDNWGIPTGGVHNEWELKFSPDVPLEMDLKVGAGEGKLDFTGLQLVQLDLGAGDFDIRFGGPNEAEMEHLTLDTGASKLEVEGIGHAGPAEVNVQGGVGDVTLDFTGDWPRSADVSITAGIGSITLRLPGDVGVWVETRGGLSSVNVSGLRRRGDAYVNDAFGEADTELRIQVTTGVGSLDLIEVPND